VEERTPQLAFNSFRKLSSELPFGIDIYFIEKEKKDSERRKKKNQLSLR